MVRWEVVLLGESGVQVYLIYMLLWWNADTLVLGASILGCARSNRVSSTNISNINKKTKEVNA